ncbi:hypothetical protein BJ742DRAFT_836888 [Cladochytrium replicatum]|nr:hypothetical protein BJ742DRAFT_836888 [Cladochytrium replicatum]
MPPKKASSKPGSAKKKAAKSQGSGGDKELEKLQEKLVAANFENDVLKREIEQRNDLNARLKLELAQHRAIIEMLQDQLGMNAQDRVDLTSDMSRQYKSMQAELKTQVQKMESQLLEYKTKLAETQAALAGSTKEYEAVIEEKDSIIEDQNVKMTYMTNEFEQMLNQTLAKIGKKLEGVSAKWNENDKLHLSEANQRRLADFPMSKLALAKLDL